MCGKRNMFKIKPNFALRIFLDTGHKLIRRSEDILNKSLMYVQLTSCVQGGTLPSRNTLGEKCPYKEFFLVRMRENTDQKRFRICTLFTQ